MRAYLVLAISCLAVVLWVLPCAGQFDPNNAFGGLGPIPPLGSAGVPNHTTPSVAELARATRTTPSVAELARSDRTTPSVAELARTSSANGQTSLGSGNQSLTGPSLGPVVLFPGWPFYPAYRPFYPAYRPFYPSYGYPSNYYYPYEGVPYGYAEKYYPPSYRRYYPPAGQSYQQPPEYQPTPASLADQLTISRRKDGSLTVSWSGRQAQARDLEFALLDKDRKTIEVQIIGAPPYSASFSSVPPAAVFLEVTLIRPDGSQDSIIRRLGRLNR